MIRFNELRIDKSNNIASLIIDASVLSVSNYFDNVAIRRVIVIKSSDYYEDLDPEQSKNVSKVFDITFNTMKDWKKYGTYNASIYNTKKIRLTLTANDTVENIDLNNDLFVVYVYTGTPSEGFVNFEDEEHEFTWNAPNISEQVCCNLSKTYDKGLVFNICKVYSAIMQNIKEIENNCDLPLNFTNIYLQYMAFKYATISCNYTEAINIYNKMFKRKYNSVNVVSCGCNK